ncbi:MAG: S1 family peptidase [Acidimicrobiales bacterium]
MNPVAPDRGLPIGEVRLDRVSAVAARRLVAVLVLGAAVVMLVELVGSNLAAGSGRDPTSPLTLRERAAAVESLTGATVRVTAVACGERTVGTGFSIAARDGVGLGPAELDGGRMDGAGFVVTNSHVVVGAGEFEVDRPAVAGTAGRPRSAVGVVGRLPSIDLAFGLGDTGGTLVRAPEDPQVGEPVLLAGYGGGDRLAILEARVHNHVDGTSYGSEGAVLLLDTPTAPGFSGGPVVDRRGRLVAVLRGYDSATALTVAVPVSLLGDALASSDMKVKEPSC